MYPDLNKSAGTEIKLRRPRELAVGVQMRFRKLYAVVKSGFLVLYHFSFHSFKRPRREEMFPTSNEIKTKLMLFKDYTEIS